DGGAERLGVEDAELLRPEVDALEIVDVEREVVVERRLPLAAEQVELLLAELQPDDGPAGEAGRRQAFHAEDVLVEPHRLVEIERVHRDVVEPFGRHRATIVSLHGDAGPRGRVLYAQPRHREGCEGVVSGTFRARYFSS